MHHDAETSYNQFLGMCVCVMSNTLVLQYSKSNKEEITMTYIINGRGSVLRLADTNCVNRSLQIIALDNIFTMIWSGYRPYTTSRSLL